MKKLPDDILAVLREERHEKGYALLKPYVIRARVLERMRKRQVIRVWVFGSLWELVCAPSMYDVRAAVRTLQEEHKSLIRVFDDEIYPSRSSHELLAN